MRNVWVFIGIFIFTVTGYLVMTRNIMERKSEIRYVALGDSYTIGEGATESESWPNVLTGHLRDAGLDIKLVANPSVTGYTTKDLIDLELSIFESSEPTFATLLIGVNDWVQGVSEEDFRENLIVILDRMQAKLPDKSKIVLVTIPDFGVTPVGANFSNGRDIAEGIDRYNMIIKSEGVRRNIGVVDIYPLTQQMKGDLVSTDGLHPSAKEYALWEKLIFPVAREILKDFLPQNK